MANGINWSSLIAGFVTLGGAISVAAGYPALGAIFSDPSTATMLTAIVTAASGLYSAFAPAILHSTTAAAAKAIGQ
jgi:hypothetical protein